MAVRVEEQGFTMIELIVVITILGILAAFALPRFVNIQNEARTSTVSSLAGSLRSASAMIHAKALVNPSVTSVTIDGQAIALTASSGYATAGAISSALQDLTGFSTNNSGTFWPTSVATSANCNVVYSTAATPPTVVVTSSDCS